MEIAIGVLFPIIAVTALLHILSKIRAFAKKWSTFRKLPGPAQTPYPPLGHALMLQGDSSEFYTAVLGVVKSTNDVGRELGCFWIGMEPVFVVSGANAAEVLLRSSEHMDKSFLYDYLHPWLGTGLLTSKGQKWKSRRRLLTPTFHFSILNEFLKSMNEQSQVFAQKLEQHARSGETFDIFSNITLCALDIICQTAMGERLYAQQNSESKYVKAVYRISDIIQKRQKSPWLWRSLIFNNLPEGREFWKLIEILHDFTNSVIKERRRCFKKGENLTGKKARRAFLDLLLEVSCDGEVLSMEDIREEVDTFMFEGHDTTAAGLAWATHAIGCHDEVQQKIHDELDEIFGDDTNREITPDDLKKMQYLERVIKESLRLFPSVPIFGRTTTSDCSIDGNEIPRGMTCLVFTQTINKRPDYWKDPEKFDPDRFTTENSVGRHPYAYIPFSAGPRNCIGQKFALMEEKVVLAHLFRKFKVKSCDETKNIRQMSDLILRPGDGINVKLQLR